VSKGSSVTKRRFHVRFFRKLLALFWSLAHALFSLFLPRSIFNRITGNAGQVTAGARLRRAPSELNFQSPSPASTGFIEDACVLILSFIDRAAACLRQPVRYVFGLNTNNGTLSAVPIPAPTASNLSAVESQVVAKVDGAQQQPHELDAVLPNSDVSARFGLSVSSIVCKAGRVSLPAFALACSELPIS
jgi:hypothetical protein